MSKQVFVNTEWIVVGMIAVALTGLILMMLKERG